MNFKDQIQQIFGTTDIHELKQISRDADNYRCLNADMNNSIISEKKKNTGRKNSFTEELTNAKQMSFQQIHNQ